MATKKNTAVTPATEAPIQTDEPKEAPKTHRWNDKAVDRKTQKTIRLNGLTFCSFSVTIKNGSTGGDLVVQKLRNVHSVIVTPVCAHLNGLNVCVAKNNVSINYEPVECESQVINVVAIGQR